VAIAAGLGVASQTIKGHLFIAFAKEAKLEVRKVVWPTRQESVQTTFIVMIATVIAALLLWGLDGALFRIVGFLTGLEI
jgi:preprotein translocase subunit SecE